MFTTNIGKVFNRVAVTAVLLLILTASVMPAVLLGQIEETLVVASMKYIKNPNPLKQETWYDWWLNLVTYDTLFREGPDLDPHPWLCSYYEHSNDGLVWTFRLVEGAYWHDGNPITSEDLVFTIEFYKRYKPPSWYPSVEFIDRVEALDKYTVRLYLSRFNAWILRTFGYMIILPKHVWSHVAEVFDDPTFFNPLSPGDVEKVMSRIEAGEPKDVSSKTKDFVSRYGHLRIGSGPYVLTRWVEGELLDLVRHPKYFKAGFPRAARLIFKVYATDEAQYLAVKKGDAHIMMWTAPYAVLDEAMRDPNLVVPKSPDVYVGFLGFNMRDPITGNKNFRKAVAYALDKNFVINTLMLGFAEKVYTFVHPGLTFWVNLEVPRYDFDLSMAARLLDDAGFKDVDRDGWRESPAGEKFEVTIYTPEYDPVRVRIGDILVENLGKIGVRAKNVPLDFDTMVDYVYNQLKFQIYIIENDANFMPWYYSSFYVEEQAVPGGNNPWGFVNKEFEDILRKAEAEPSDTARADLYKRLQLILAEELPILPIYVRYWIQVYRRELSGVVDMPGGALNFWTLINGNFRGLAAELPYTILQPPVTTVPTPLATVTIVQTTPITVTSPVWVTYTARVEVPYTPPELVVAAVVAVVAVGVLMFLLGRRYGK
ncbi:MAG: ABC transporter substrate-binding protein [Sulfolobales archaeon]